MIQEKSYRPLGHVKALALGLLLVALVSMMLAARTAHAASLTFTVDSTADLKDAGIDGVCDGAPIPAVKTCTLRAAIEEANANPGADTIRFNIPDSVDPGVKTIKATTSMRITEAVTIDGYTQPGASPNTLEQGTNAKIMIELDGTGGVAEAFGIFANDSAVRGLAINRYGASGIVILGSNNKVEGNFLGTDPTGTQALGNRIAGVTVVKPNLGPGGASNTIGGTSPDKRNLISGNVQQGVQILSGTQDNFVLGNLIGTDKSGTAPLGNGSAGVQIQDASNNGVGGRDDGKANTIAFNGGDGVAIRSFNNTLAETGNFILSNSIFSNEGLGINLFGGTENEVGDTANDLKDPDTGPNNLQNKPVIVSAINSGGTTIKGSLNSTPNSEFLVEFYSNPRGTDEGKKFIGSTQIVRTDADGNATYTLGLFQPIAVGQTVTATATNLADGNTSEFSAPETVADGVAPRVNRVNPAENATGVAARANVSAFFSEEMSANTLNTNTVKLVKKGTTAKVSAKVTYVAAKKQVILNPNANLQAGATYVATVTAGAKDLAGNRLDQNPNAAGNQAKVWKFTVKP